MTQFFVWGGVKEQDTQQENSYTKHAVTNRIPVTAMLDRANEASHWNLSTKYCHERGSSMANCFFRRKLKGLVA